MCKFVFSFKKERFALYKVDRTIRQQEERRAKRKPKQHSHDDEEWEL